MKPCASVVPIRAASSASIVPPPDGDGNAAHAYHVENVDIRGEKRRYARRVTKILDPTVRKFRIDLQTRLYELAHKYELELPACEELSRQYLAQRWREQLFRAA